jgi:hypothetical protein
MPFDVSIALSCPILSSWGAQQIRYKDQSCLRRIIVHGSKATQLAFCFAWQCYLSGRGEDRPHKSVWGHGL